MRAAITPAETLLPPVLSRTNLQLTADRRHRPYTVVANLAGWPQDPRSRRFSRRAGSRGAVWWTTGVCVRICSQNYHVLTAPFACADEIESARTEPTGPNASGWAWAAPQMMRIHWAAFEDPALPTVPIPVTELRPRLSPPPLRHQNHSRHMCGPLPRVRRNPRVLARSHLPQVRA